MFKGDWLTGTNRLLPTCRAHIYSATFPRGNRETAIRAVFPRREQGNSN